MTDFIENPFMKLMGGYTSDHTWQMMNIQVPSIPLSVDIATWNLQNKCISKATNQTKGKGIPYSNNPADIDETEKQYAYRKEIQLEQIKEIQEVSSAIFLQEADVFINSKLVQVYRDQVEHDDWQLLVSPKFVYQKPVAILYNSKVFQLEDAGTPIMEYNGRYHGYEWRFTEKTSCAPIALASLHLDYTYDFSEQISIHQENLKNQGITGILGGDTNHTPHNIKGLLGNPNYATNMNSYDGILSIIDARLSFSADNEDMYENHKKKYDGFFVNSPSDDVDIIAIESGGQYIDVIDNSIIVKDLPLHIEF